MKERKRKRELKEIKKLRSLLQDRLEFITDPDIRDNINNQRHRLRLHADRLYRKGKR